MSVLLEVNGINVTFDGFKAINNLSLSISNNELRAIIGPNGAGKTTFMDIVTRFFHCSPAVSKTKKHLFYIFLKLHCNIIKINVTVLSIIRDLSFKIFEIIETYKMVHSVGSHEPRPSDDRVFMLMVMVNVDMVDVEVMVMMVG